MMTKTFDAAYTADSNAVNCHVETVTGRFVNPVEPSVDTIDIVDIAWALSRISRFVGHSITEVPYNVAQHSIYVSELLEILLTDPDQFSGIKYAEFDTVLESAEQVKNMYGQSAAVRRLILLGLFHDAHEAYIGDMPSPIKRIPELRPIIKNIEAKLDAVIMEKIGVSGITDYELHLVKFCDKLAQAIEGYQFMPSRGSGWDVPKPSIEMIQRFRQPSPALESMQQFMNRYKSCTKRA